MTFEFEDGVQQYAQMKVIGVGGAGGNAINRMISAQLSGVEFIAANTDAQALEFSQAPYKVQIGKNVTRGLGAGGDPEIGRRAAEEDREIIASALANADMVFVAAGMGGGTGTGATPIVAEVARELGALAVAVVTKPFLFEGQERMAKAEQGLVELQERVDTLIVIPNQRLLSLVSRDTTLQDAFRLVDEVLLQATRGISDLISTPGLINLDFADVKTVMANMGPALMGTASARGENRAVEAAQLAISSPLLENTSIADSKSVLVNITGGRDLTLHEVNDAASTVYEAVGPNANIIFGAVVDENMQEEIRITVIATGFGDSEGGNGRSLKVGYCDLTNPRLESLDRPAFQRKRELKEQRANLNVKHIEPPSFALDDLEIPTFLRKQIKQMG